MELGHGHELACKFVYWTKISCLPALKPRTSSIAVVNKHACCMSCTQKASATCSRNLLSCICQLAAKLKFLQAFSAWDLCTQRSWDWNYAFQIFTGAGENLQSLDWFDQYLVLCTGLDQYRQWGRRQNHEIFKKKFLRGNRNWSYFTPLHGATPNTQWTHPLH